MKKGKILMKTVVFALGIAIATAIIQLRSNVKDVLVCGNVIFCIIWGILLTACGINAYFMNLCDALEHDKELATTAFYLQILCLALWCILFFAYGNFVFSTAISIVLLAISNVATVLFKRTGKKYFITMLFAEIWAVFLIFTSMIGVLE